MSSAVVPPPNPPDLHSMCMAVKWVHKNMIERCCNQSADNYKWYGGRGISVCQRWLDSIQNFAVDMGPRPTDGTLDRINNDGNYEPTNCRWANRIVQARNRPGLIAITIWGETKCPAAWAEDRRCKPTRAALYKRLQAGWDGVRAVTEPMSRNKQHRIVRTDIYSRAWPTAKQITKSFRGVA